MRYWLRIDDNPFLLGILLGPLYLGFCPSVCQWGYSIYRGWRDWNLDLGWFGIEFIWGGG